MVEDSHTPRLDRALEHLKTLECQIRDWQAENLRRMREEHDAKTGEDVLVVYPKPLDITFGILIGEIVQALRIALDNLAYSLAATYTDPLPAAAAETSEFPIFWTGPMSASAQRRKVGSIDPKAVAIIKGLQPHVRGPDFANDPLWQIHELSRVDKHRALHAVAMAYEGSGLVINSGYVVKMEAFSPQVMEGRTEVARYIIRPVAADQPVDVQMQPSFGVVLPTGSPRGGVPVLNALAGLRNYVITDVVARLASFL